MDLLVLRGDEHGDDAKELELPSHDRRPREVAVDEVDREEERLLPQAVLHVHLHEPVHEDGAHLVVDVHLPIILHVVRTRQELRLGPEELGVDVRHVLRHALRIPRVAILQACRWDERELRARGRGSGCRRHGGRRERRGWDHSGDACGGVRGGEGRGLLADGPAHVGHVGDVVEGAAATAAAGDARAGRPRRRRVGRRPGRGSEGPPGIAGVPGGPLATGRGGEASAEVGSLILRPDVRRGALGARRRRGAAACGPHRFQQVRPIEGHGDLP
mmetsp:Transcript_13364/g.35311  ORF Transcript_13364/g.35311 Transcript_13364/m.35311 type:complete len:273 (-) Transcript_13364:182-1000(-)